MEGDHAKDGMMPRIVLEERKIKTANASISSQGIYHTLFTYPVLVQPKMGKVLASLYHIL
jgi:hypothetical protein